MFTLLKKDGKEFSLTKLKNKITKFMFYVNLKMLDKKQRVVSLSSL